MPVVPPPKQEEKVTRLDVPVTQEEVNETPWEFVPVELLDPLIVIVPDVLVRPFVVAMRTPGLEPDPEEELTLPVTEMEPLVVVMLPPLK